MGGGGRRALMDGRCCVRSRMMYRLADVRYYRPLTTTSPRYVGLRMSDSFTTHNAYPLVYFRAVVAIQIC
ncbi:hypothetical protein J6590_011229 [Homalodisca vitripennis]|nr:hypothetical protein J6590_011229 [Homalodisca vitripennis]